MGSPLIALKAVHPATQFRFNEKDIALKSALDQRISVSPLKDRVKTYQRDLNEVVTEICNEIQVQDKMRGSLNLAFLDPEGLELQWSTVERLASVKRMDLIINFSTGGLVRAIGKGYFDVVNQFFGTDKWREIDIHPTNSIARRRAFIDFYRKRLEQFGYHIDIDSNLGGDDIAVRNSKNAEVYSIIFASKHELGDKFWKQVAKNVKPPRLPGFE